MDKIINISQSFHGIIIADTRQGTAWRAAFVNTRPVLTAVFNAFGEKA